MNDLIFVKNGRRIKLDDLTTVVEIVEVKSANLRTASDELIRQPWLDLLKSNLPMYVLLAMN